MNLIITLAICISASFLLTWISKKLKISVIVGLIVTGILIGSPFLKEIILGPNTNFILNLGEVALIFLMFLAGLEVSWKMLYQEKNDALIVAFFAAIIPFLLGFIIFLFMGFPLLTSLTIGICMSITAEATKARVLLELKKLKTKIGSLMMGAGIIDDLIGIFLFLIIAYAFTKTFVSKELLMLGSAILAFFIGVAVRRPLKKGGNDLMLFEKMILTFIIPFFFIAMGIHFNLQSLALNFSLLLIILAIAIAGKIIGVLLTKPFAKLSFKQLYLIGWGMNSRGAVELAIAFVAFKIGLFDIHIYSSLVVMALVTTLIFPFFIRRMVKKEPNIMN